MRGTKNKSHPCAEDAQGWGATPPTCAANSRGSRSPPPPVSIIVIPIEVRDLQFFRPPRKCRSLAPLGMTNKNGMTKKGGPRCARDGKQERDDKQERDKSQKVSANSASSAVRDLDVFRALVKSGQRLAEIHVHYERQPEYPLTKTEKAGEKLDWRVTKMRLSRDKTSLIYNDFLTLSEIPKETYDYRLGNRSALEWVIDQYQVSTDRRSGITNNPNREDDPQYIVRLIGQVITVSLETVKIVKELPELRIPETAGGDRAG
jgi:hypothetical protein